MLICRIIDIGKIGIAYLGIFIELEHSVNGSFHFPFVVLIDATCVHPSPIIFILCSEVTERCQLLPAGSLSFSLPAVLAFFAFFFALTIPRPFEMIFQLLEVIFHVIIRHFGCGIREPRVREYGVLPVSRCSIAFDQFVCLCVQESHGELILI